MEWKIDHLKNRCDNICKGFLEFVNSEDGLKLALTMEDLDWKDDVDSPWGKAFDGCVVVFANEDYTEYEVGYETFDPGGRWEPPSSDYATNSKHKNLQDALWEILKLCLQDYYRMWCENKYAQQWAMETEEYYEDIEEQKTQEGHQEKNPTPVAQQVD